LPFPRKQIPILIFFRLPHDNIVEKIAARRKIYVRARSRLKSGSRFPSFQPAPGTVPPRDSLFFVAATRIFRPVHATFSTFSARRQSETGQNRRLENIQARNR
jgi:hypothetical protein